jgi:hypothetical protein
MVWLFRCSFDIINKQKIQHLFITDFDDFHHLIFYLIFSIMVQTLTFPSFVLIFLIPDPQKILDFLQISPISFNFHIIVLILYRIWRFTEYAGDGPSWLWPGDGLGNLSLRWFQGKITWERKDPNCILDFLQTPIRVRFLSLIDRFGQRGTVSSSS